jgi:hypothetical protein
LLTPITTFVHLLVIGWLPGAAIFRLPFAERDKRAALDAEERLFWAVMLSVAISAAVVVALAVVNRYTFERLLLADAGIAAAAALVGRFDLRLGSAARRAGLTAIVPLVLVLLAAWRFFPPAEYVMGGKDPGTYVNEGIQIAQRGTLFYNDPVVATVPPFARDLFFPSHLRDDYYSLRFMGFWIKDPDTGRVTGQFPHLFPATIAIGYGLDGLTGARRASSVWALLGVLAVYFAGQRLFGRTAAGAAAALLTLHVLEVWFARYPNAELAMQALLFAALLASARAHVDDDRFFAPVAGALLGLLLFLRFDAVLVIGAVVASIAVGTVAGALKSRPGFFVALIATSALAAVYLFRLMPAYMALPIIFLSNFKSWQYALLGAGCLAIVALMVLGPRSPQWSARIRGALPILVAAVVVVAALYALFLRQPIDRVLAPRDAFALRTFANFYVTLPGLLAALLGFWLFARRAFWRAPELFMTVAFFSFFFFYKIRIASDHFWMARRFLPVILPGALLFATAAALGGTRGGWAPTRAVRRIIGLAFVAVLAVQYARAARPILPHVEYAGIIPKLEEITGRIGDRDLLIVETRLQSDTHVLALPLAYIYARNVLVFSSPKPDKAVFAAFLDWARTKYDRVLFMGGGGTDLVSPAWSARPIASERFTIPEYDAPADAYPRYAREKEFDYSLYELTPPAPDEATRPFDLDVGTNDDLYVVRFHSKERTEGRSIRWSRDRSFITVTGIGAASREIVLTMNDGGRPPAVPRADVTIGLEGEPLGTVTVHTGFNDYTVTIPPALAARVSAQGRAAELTLTTTVWVPEKVLGTSDPRELGVMVDRVAIR